MSIKASVPLPMSDQPPCVTTKTKPLKIRPSGMFLRVRFNTSTLSWSLYPSKTESIPSSIRDNLDAVSLILLIFIAFSGFSMISHRCALSSESSIPKTLHKFLTEFNGNEHIASPCHFRYCKIFPYVRAQVVCTFITGLPIPHCTPPPCHHDHLHVGRSWLPICKNGWWGRFLPLPDTLLDSGAASKGILTGGTVRFCSTILCTVFPISNTCF
jgi:hypothetical protein